MISVLRPLPVHQIRLIVFDLDGTLIDSRKDPGRWPHRGFWIEVEETHKQWSEDNNDCRKGCNEESHSPPGTQSLRPEKHPANISLASSRIVFRLGLGFPGHRSALVGVSYWLCQSIAGFSQASSSKACHMKLRQVPTILLLANQ